MIRTLVTGLLVGCMLVACQDVRQAEEPAEAAESPPQATGSSAEAVEAPPAVLLVAADSLEDVVEWVGELELEEEGAHVVADPNLRVDPAGGWLYWDKRLNQAGVYASDGTLQAVFGRPGNGPGEFRGIQSLVRLDDSRLVTIDGRGRVAVWRPDTYELEKDFASNVNPVVGAVALPGARLLVVTRTELDSLGVPAAPILHVIDVASERVVLSGFTPTVTEQSVTALMTVAPPSPRLIGDSVYFGLPIFDTIWAIARAGSDLNARPVALSSRVAANAPAVRVSGSSAEPCVGAGSSCAAAFRTWVEQSIFVGGFYPVGPGRAIVHTWGVPDRKPVNWYHLLDSSGAKRWEVASSLVLLEVDERGLLYFWDPSGLVPNRVRIARLR